MDLASLWMGSQPHPTPIWKVTKTEAMSFLMIIVAPKLLVCKSPQGVPSPRTLGANWQVTQRLMRPGGGLLCRCGHS